MGLSEDQVRLAAWYVDGVSLRQIAEWLCVDERTIRRQLCGIRNMLAIAGLTMNRLDKPGRRRVRTMCPSLAKAL